MRLPRASRLSLMLPSLLLLLSIVPANASHGQQPSTSGLDRKIRLELTETTAARDIYRALGDAAGLAVVFAPDFHDRMIHVDLEDLTVRQGLVRSTQAAGHFWRQLDERSLLVADDTPQNRHQYEELFIQTFYLENSEVADIMTLLRSLVDAKKLAVNEPLDAIVMRDTAERIAVARRLIQSQEKPRAEVEVTLELLAVDSEQLAPLARKLGGDTGAVLPSRLSAAELAELKGAAGVQTLAAPRLHTVDGERVKLVLGEAVPIPRTLPTEDGGGTEGQVPISYQEIGLEVTVEPQVHAAAGEMTLKLDLGLSGRVRGAENGVLPTIARRSVTSRIRLADGQTCLLSGLLGLEAGDGSEWAALPLLVPGEPAGERKELVLALTPHLIRRPEITERDRRAWAVGSESRMTLDGAER